MRAFSALSCSIILASRPAAMTPRSAKERDKSWGKPTLATAPRTSRHDADRCTSARTVVSGTINRRDTRCEAEQLSPQSTRPQLKVELGFSPRRLYIHRQDQRRLEHPCSQVGKKWPSAGDTEPNSAPTLRKTMPSQQEERERERAPIFHQAMGCMAPCHVRAVTGSRVAHAMSTSDPPVSAHYGDAAQVVLGGLHLPLLRRLQALPLGRTLRGAVIVQPLLAIAAVARKQAGHETEAGEGATGDLIPYACGSGRARVRAPLSCLRKSPPPALEAPVLHSRRGRPDEPPYDAMEFASAAEPSAHLKHNKSTTLSLAEDSRSLQRIIVLRRHTCCRQLGDCSNIAARNAHEPCVIPENDR